MLTIHRGKQTTLHSHHRVVQTPNHGFPRKAAISTSHGPGTLSGRRDTAPDRAEPGCVAPPAWVRTSPVAPASVGELLRPGAGQEATGTLKTAQMH